MSLYHQIIYGWYPKSNFNKKLVPYLVDKCGIKVWTEWDGYSGFHVADHNTLLEIGFGEGDIIKEFEKIPNLKVTGIDYDKFHENRGTIQLDEPWDFNKKGLSQFTDESFSYVFTKSVIEHIPDTEFFIKECKRVLKKNGTLVILTPAWEYNWKDYYNDYTHIKPFHRKGLQDALDINGFCGNAMVEYHYHLPWSWGKRPWVMPIILFLRLFSRWKWKDSQERVHRPNIRFAQEVQLLAIARKLN